MEPKLKLIDHYLIWQNADVVQIRAQQKTLLLRGELVRHFFSQVLALLDGRYTQNEILAILNQHEHAAQLQGLFAVLQQKELLAPVEACPSALQHLPSGKLEALARFFANYSSSAWQTITMLQQCRVLLFGQPELLIPIALGLSHLMVGQICLMANPVTAADCAHSRYLTDADIGLHPAAVVQRLVAGELCSAIVATDGYPDSVLDWRQQLQPFDLIITADSQPIIFNDMLAELNQAVLLTGTRWLPLAVIDNKELQLGPAILPGQTACYKCFEYRLRSNLSHLEHYDAFAETFNSLKQRPDFGVLAPFSELLANYAVLEAMKLLSDDYSAISIGKLQTFSLDQFNNQSHPVLKIPRCPHCSEFSARCPERIWG
jgi:bacteriocin biosynthesis cyclodehydratase domain-containing protein